MFNINWSSFIANNIPMEWITTYRVSWLNVILSQIKALYNTFIAYRDTVLYNLSFNAQIMNLRHVLNDRFDNSTRAIYIDNVADRARIYWYNSSELREPFYSYNNYDAAVTYAVGEFSVLDNKVWKALNISTGSAPSSINTDWEYYKNVVFFKNLDEYSSLYDYIVMVPVAVTFDLNEMKALINKYNAGGMRYTIQTY